MKSIGLIIRFHYKENDPRFDWRFSYFKAIVLPRILNQSDKDFDICIWCEPHHDNLFKGLSEKIKVFHSKIDTVKYKVRSNGKKYYYDFIDFENLEGLEKYDIQVGIDSDDLMGFDYIRAIRMQTEGKSQATHICFQPKTFNLKTLMIKPMIEYKKNRGSAFFALFQPDKSNYKFIYCDSHISMGKYAKESIILPAGHCWATIHYINESTGK
jgi:hypothetical protein